MGDSFAHLQVRFRPDCRETLFQHYHHAQACALCSKPRLRPSFAQDGPRPVAEGRVASQEPGDRLGQVGMSRRLRPGWGDLGTSSVWSARAEVIAFVVT